MDQERDELYEEIYRLRLTLADAWKITLATDAEKVREVADCTREQSTRKVTAAAKEKKLYSAVVKSNVTPALNITYQIEKKMNLMICSNP